MGDFTLGEIIGYYKRADVLSIMYYQTVRWPSEMRFLGKFEALRPSSPKELGQRVVQFILQHTAGMRMDEKPPEYPTFDVKADRHELIEQRYDWITEDDPESWQEAFEKMKLVLDILDRFGVYYQIQFSGNRSLHLRIPAEAFPPYFQGKPIADYQIVERDETGHRWIYNPLHRAINHYLPPSGHSPFSLRMTYTTHPMTGFVALPLRRGELEVFHPQMASIRTVKVDSSWFSVPEDAPKRTADFLRAAVRQLGIDWQDFRQKKEEKIMSNVEEIKAAIEALAEPDYVQLRQWFSEKDWEKWDRQIEADSKSGKLDFLVAEALEEKEKGTLKEL